MNQPGSSIVDRIVARLPSPGARRPFVLGIAGAQGSGKSTVARALSERFAAPVLSLDDLYLSGAARTALAEQVHPLLRTRGVPGTHDPARGLAVIESLAAPGTTWLPRFDKARDEPGPPNPWQGPAEMLILEGWCLGARPQAETALVEPVNTLERAQDADGRWRRWVNARLADYAPLFARIDMLVFLAAPGFEVVERWRGEQEQALRGGGMDEAALRVFVQHFQRLTEHMLSTAPEHADLTIRLDPNRAGLGESG